MTSRVSYATIWRLSSENPRGSTNFRVKVDKKTERSRLKEDLYGRTGCRLPSLFGKRQPFICWERSWISPWLSTMPPASPHGKLSTLSRLRHLRHQASQGDSAGDRVSRRWQACKRAWTRGSVQAHRAAGSCGTAMRIRRTAQSSVRGTAHVPGRGSRS